MRFLLTLALGLFINGSSLADQRLGLPPLTIPDDNAPSLEKTALGKRLFNDQRLSGDGSISCARCHVPGKGFTDALPAARGIKAQTGMRNTPTIINAAFYQTLFLDGRAASLEDQVLGPLLNPIEHGLQNPQAVVAVVRADAEYVRQFKAAFGMPSAEIAIGHVVKALAAYERTLVAGNSRFDRYLFGRDHSVLSKSAECGMRIFQRKGNCITCHEISWNHALFTDNRFYNLGVGSQQLTPIFDMIIDAGNNGKNSDELPLNAAQRSELGRFNVTKNISDLGKFKTPILRNVASTAPYMHDGSLKTLEDVIDFYGKGGEKNQWLDKKIFPMHLTEQKKGDLVAFLKSLTSQPLDFQLE